MNEEAAPLDDGGSSATADEPADGTAHLLTRARGGDAEALDVLFARHLPNLRRWARGRLPRWARDMADTTDLVQDTLLQVFKRIDGFEARGAGALQAYLRQALMNRIRNEFRRASRQADRTSLDPDFVDDGTSPVEAAIGREAMERYEAALGRLSSIDREAVVCRIELGMSHEEIAEALGKPSAGAARVAVSRALVKLAEAMGHTHGHAG
jgi:RNA polymerase sigma-70 factor (ECF subfamily)